MASSRIKGITVEIGGDTTGLSKALAGVNKDISNTQTELRDVNRLLKLDPKNTELLSQKQQLLKDAIAKTGDKLKALREAEKQVQQQFKRGEVTEEQYNRLKREIAATEIEERKLNDQLKHANTNLNKQDESLRKNIISAQLAVDAFKAVGKAVFNMAKDAVEYNAEMESYTAAFTSFLGDAEQAEKAIANIKEDASGMTFGTDSLIQANQLLITAGVSAEDSREAINALAESVAATGGGDAELSRMAQNLQQIRNVGKASSMDIKQFANAGINVYGLLSDYTGKNVDELKDMEISYDDLVGAMKKATSEGGKYYGAMTKQAQTYNGRLNALKSRIKETLGTTFKSVSDNLKNNIFPAINKALDKIDFEKLGKSISKIVTAVGEILPVVLPVIAGIINGVGDVIDALMPLVQAVSRALTDIIDLVQNGFAGDWSNAWSSILRIVSNMFDGLLTAVANVINKIIDAVNTVIGWFGGNPFPKIAVGNIDFNGSNGGGRQGSFASGGVINNDTSKPTGFLPTEGKSTTNNNNIEININGANANPKQIAAEVEHQLSNQLRRAYNAG